MMEQRDGWFWPADDRDGQRAVLRDWRTDINEVLRHVPDRRLIVQAGGNVGVYPLALSDHFNCVHTFEPDPANYACLVKNVAARDALRRLVIHNAALGQTPGYCSPVVVEAMNCGAHRVEFSEAGKVPVLTIDELALEACGCIWLDIEGAEVFALRGAVDTIRRLSPTLVVEDKGLGETSFGRPPREIQSLMLELRYEEVARYGRDKVFRRTT